MRLCQNLLPLFLAAIFICNPTPGTASESDPASKIGLEGFIEIALRNNPAVDSARNQVQAAEGRSTQAVSSYLPQLSANADSSVVHIIDGDDDAEGTITSASLAASQLIFDFGKTTGSIAAAGHDVDAARDFLNSVGSDLIFSVKDAYYRILAAHYLIEVAGEQVANLKRHYERTREYYKAGVRSKIDVTNAEVELTDARLQLLQSQYGLKSARVNLEKVIGTAPDNGRYLVEMYDFGVSDFAHRLPVIPSSLEDLLHTAGVQRPDLAQAQKEIASSQSVLHSVQGDYWPEIGATGSYQAYDTDTQSPLLQDQWQVGIGLNWQFFSGLRTQGAVTEAKSNLRSSRARLRDVQLSVTQQVSDSYHLAQEKRESVFLADKGLKLSSEYLYLADERYKSGLGDMIEFNDAQLRFTVASTNLVNTFFDYKTALASLEQALGVFPDMAPPSQPSEE